MWRSCRQLLLLRPLTAAFGNTRYDLSKVSGLAHTWRVPVHISFPVAGRHYEQARGKKELQVILMEPADEQHVAVFANGCIVGFNMTKESLTTFQEMLRSSEEPQEDTFHLPHSIVHSHRFTYVDELPSLGFAPPEGVDSSFIDDGTLNAVVLESTAPDTKIPFVYCLADLMLLEATEQLLTPYSTRIKRWQAYIHAHGTLPFSLREARVNKARLYKVKDYHQRIGRPPKILWEKEYSHLRHLYDASAEHFEIEVRKDMIGERIASAEGSLGYMCDEIHAAIGVRLEWVIIVLIAVEILITIRDHTPSLPVMALGGDGSGGGGGTVVVTSHPADTVSVEV